MKAEEALSIVIAIAGIWHCLFVCRVINAAVQDAVIAEGYVNVASLAELGEKDIHEMENLLTHMLTLCRQLSWP
jgi:hypothetical protein